MRTFTSGTLRIFFKANAFVLALQSAFRMENFNLQVFLHGGFGTFFFCRSWRSESSLQDRVSGSLQEQQQQQQHLLLPLQPAPSPLSADIAARRGLNPVSGPGRHAELRERQRERNQTLSRCTDAHLRTQPGQRGKLPPRWVFFFLAHLLAVAHGVRKRRSVLRFCFKTAELSGPVCGGRAAADFRLSCTCCSVAETPAERQTKRENTCLFFFFF